MIAQNLLKNNFFLAWAYHHLGYQILGSSLKQRPQTSVAWQQKTTEIYKRSFLRILHPACRYRELYKIPNS
jgi:hypothetical protein